VGVEPTTRLAKSRINGFEGHEDHRTPFASDCPEACPIEGINWQAEMIGWDTCGKQAKAEVPAGLVGTENAHFAPIPPRASLLVRQNHLAEADCIHVAEHRRSRRQ
jgi:hypothetical protein